MNFCNKAIKEARRVLKDDGSLLVGLYVEGGKDEKLKPKHYIKEIVRDTLVFAGFKRYKDTTKPFTKHKITTCEQLKNM